MSRDATTDCDRNKSLWWYSFRSNGFIPQPIADKYWWLLVGPRTSRPMRIIQRDGKPGGQFTPDSKSRVVQQAGGFAEWGSIS